MEASDQFSESDIHSALAELDKGLRSGVMSDQIEVIFKFPTHVSRFPFPLYINAAFLKMAEAFHSGTNLVKGSILRVVEGCPQGSLEKIISVDEVLRRVFSVSLSNDPVARSLCLRTIGALVPLVSQKKNLHHLIISSLRTSNSDEMLAAIEASCCFAKYSKEFSSSILEEVSDLLQGVQTPVKVKLQLADILSHMHAHTGTTCAVVRLCEKQLLPNCASKNLQIKLLSCLTKLAIETFAIVSDQLNLLVDLLENPTSRLVINHVLDNLAQLAKHSPHMCNNKHILTLLTFAEKYCQPPNGIKSAKLTVNCIQSIVEHPFAVVSLGESRSKIVDLCSNYASCSDLSLAAQSTKCLIYIAKADGMQELSDICLTNLIVLIDKMKAMQDLVIVKDILKCVSLLSSISPDMSTCLSHMLMSQYSQNDDSSQCSELVLNTLNCMHKHESVDSQWLINAMRNRQHASMTLFSLLLSNCKCSDLLTSELMTEMVDKCENQWITYKLARMAIRYCHYELAQKAMQSVVHTDLCNDSVRLWLETLLHICVGEANLHCGQGQNSTVQMLYKYKIAAEKYAKAMAVLTVCRSYHDSKVHPFCMKMYKCRYDMILAVIKTLTAINHAQMINNYDRLKNTHFSLIESSDEWNELSRFCFDADSKSVEYLKIMSVLTKFMATTVRIIQGDQISELNTSISMDSLKTNERIMQGVEYAKDMIAKCQSDTQSQNVFYATTAFIALINIAFSYPRFFFQTQQHTKIMLHVWPQPSGSSNHVTVRGSDSLAVKVEGVIQYSTSSQTPTHKVKQVIVNLQFNPVSMTTNCEGISKRVDVSRDYFVSEFVIDVQESGTITVSPQLVDSEFGMPWESHMTATLNVNSAH